MGILELPTSAILVDAIFVAFVLVYLPFLLVAYGRLQAGYDMSAPRAMFDKLPPFAQRATWAHQNSFEAFMLFSAAALCAYVTGQDSQLAAVCAIAFVVARLLYSVFYILNIPLARSLMFAVGSTCITILFVLSLLAVNQLG
ncbi:MAPEG family protein [Capilliphycus salinus ALCB114379]|uniref:MAPEG family protein n=1 Tax=Capilliphycus salinus TaxID=2768948 RepID=UPI0039A4E053